MVLEALPEKQLTFLTNLQTIMGGGGLHKCIHNDIINKITGIELLPTSELISMALTF